MCYPLYILSLCLTQSIQNVNLATSNSPICVRLSPPPTRYLVLLGSDTGWRSTVATILDRSDTDDSLVDSSLNTVVLLDVKLWQLVVLEGSSFLDISQSRGVDDVSDQESLDSLILWNGLGSGGTSVVKQELKQS